MAIHLKQQSQYVAGVTAGVVVAGLACAIPAHATTLVVHPGQSVQQAVDRAKPGDTVLVRAGTFRESVQISVSGVKLRGAGRGTVIAPGPAGTGNACALAGHGVCVTGTAELPLTGVRISSLTVAGFAKNGVWGTWTDGMTVRRVLAENNGQQGIGQDRSVRGVFRGNTSRNNGESGIFLANTVDTEGAATDTLGTVVRHNRLTGNRIGVVVRRLRNLTVERNTMTGNCGGVFVVGDEGVPRAGALTVSHNAVTANNKFCPSNGRLPFIQGTGILLTGAEQTLVTRNEVRDNKGTSPMSGGIVLYPSVVGAPNARNTITRNTVLGNGPADLADRDPAGTGNTFTASVCQVSEPAGRC